MLFPLLGQTTHLLLPLDWSQVTQIPPVAQQNGWGLQGQKVTFLQQTTV